MCHKIKVNTLYIIRIQFHLKVKFHSWSLEMDFLDNNVKKTKHYM